MALRARGKFASLGCWRGTSGGGGGRPQLDGMDSCDFPEVGEASYVSDDFRTVKNP